MQPRGACGRRVERTQEAVQVLATATVLYWRVGLALRVTLAQRGQLLGGELLQSVEPCSRHVPPVVAHEVVGGVLGDDGRHTRQQPY